MTEPTGFTVPTGNANSITANVSPGGVSAPNVVVGQSLEVPAQITLIGAPGSATVVTLVSSDPTKLRFGTSATDPGAGTIPIPGCTPPVPDPTNVCKIIKIGAGQSHSPEFYIQALAGSGSATYTATIPGFGTQHRDRFVRTLGDSDRRAQWPWKYHFGGEWLGTEHTHDRISPA